LGHVMLPCVPETIPILVETLGEDEGGVEEVTRILIAKIEEHLGQSLDGYLGA